MAGRAREEGPERKDRTIRIGTQSARDRDPRAPPTSIDTRNACARSLRLEERVLSTTGTDRIDLACIMREWEVFVTATASTGVPREAVPLRPYEAGPVNQRVVGSNPTWGARGIGVRTTRGPSDTERLGNQNPPPGPAARIS